MPNKSVKDEAETLLDDIRGYLGNGVDDLSNHDILMLWLGHSVKKWNEGAGPEAFRPFAGFFKNDQPFQTQLIDWLKSETDKQSQEREIDVSLLAAIALTQLLKTLSYFEIGTLNERNQPILELSYLDFYSVLMILDPASAIRVASDIASNPDLNRYHFATDRALVEELFWIVQAESQCASIAYKFFDNVIYLVVNEYESRGLLNASRGESPGQEARLLRYVAVARAQASTELSDSKTIYEYWKSLAQLDEIYCTYLYRNFRESRIKRWDLRRDEFYDEMRLIDHRHLESPLKESDASGDFLPQLFSADIVRELISPSEYFPTIVVNAETSLPPPVGPAARPKSSDEVVSLPANKTTARQTLLNGSNEGNHVA